jgi:hypothetical protein
LRRCWCGRWLPLWRRGGRRGAHATGDRRIQQHGVLAQQAATLPLDLDQEIQERIAHVARGGYPHHGATLIIATQREFEIGRDDRRTIDADAGECLRGREPDPEFLEFCRRGTHHRYFGDERLIKARPHLDVAQTQRKCLAAAERKRQSKREPMILQHLVYPPKAAAGFPHRFVHEPRNDLTSQT